MMKKIVSYFLLLAIFCSCKGQDKIEGHYLGYKFISTKNKGYLCQELKFITNKDTLKVNVRIPYDIVNHNIVNTGIFYSCHLKEGTKYTLTLKKICTNDIRKESNSYYKTNTIPDKKDCSKFIEVVKNTEYSYIGDYGKYVDINGFLYEIIGLSPNDNCFFPH